jgi:hypothetical protein
MSMIHLAKLLRPGGLRAVVAETLLIKDTSCSSSRARRRAPLAVDAKHRTAARLSDLAVRAINEQNPVLGLELTATPFVETSRGPMQFKNVILDYPLGRAMADGFVKEPAVVTRKNFNPVGMSADQLEG